MLARRAAAAVERAEVAVVAGLRGADASPVRALVRIRAELPVVTRHAVGLLRVRAVARRGLARTREVALVEGGAGLVGAGVALTRGAHVPDRALVTVVARRAVGRDRVRAEPGGRVARARDVAVVLRRARDRAGTRAHARLAGVDRRAHAAVAARRAVTDRRVPALVVLTRVRGAGVLVVAAPRVHALDLLGAVRPVLVLHVGAEPLGVPLLLEAHVLVDERARVLVVRVPGAVGGHRALREVGLEDLHLVGLLDGDRRPRGRLRRTAEHRRDHEELRGPLHEITHFYL